MEFFTKLEEVLRKRKNELPEKSYTAELFRDGIDRILKKIGEEAGEVIIAAKNPNEKELIHEVADLIFHVEVLLVEKGLSLEIISKELEKRHS
jgi:phosphoribosyl-ATP pyrophosphohydrolase/phosphoribosyl-ATP pyrophosphohydrolase/phosphoribosyl-AMP cyclohydrolase